uniref:Uncharacterized protein n=1 Tax=Janibacter limosus TaxID=53458 RepID=A0AC61U304_9MICO|nr:hypothetical protein [Janibacter limosus]
MSTTPRKGADPAKLVATLVVATLAATLGGWWLLTGTGAGGVDGRVFYTGDRPTSMTIGPNGWFAYADDDGEWVEHAPTGERWGGERLYGAPVLTSDGAAVSTLGPDVRVARASGVVVTEGSDLLVAHGDKELQPGDEVEVIGLSARHAAVVSCLSPAGEARLGKDVPGGGSSSRASRSRTATWRGAMTPRSGAPPGSRRSTRTGCPSSATS